MVTMPSNEPHSSMTTAYLDLSPLEVLQDILYGAVLGHHQDVAHEVTGRRLRL